MIITDEQALRKACLDVLPEEIGEIREALEKELKQSGVLGRPGLGLAAPQIGIYKKMAIIRLDHVKIDLINASIDKVFDQIIFENEGCLSFPGCLERTKRYKEIHILDNIGEPNRFIATNLLAVACQHEYDHLRGILLPDVAIKEAVTKRLRPNDLCWCNSLKKYKKCHGRSF